MGIKDCMRGIVLVLLLLGCTSQTDVRRAHREKVRQLLEMKKGGLIWQDPDVINYTPPALPTSKMIKDAQSAGEIPQGIDLILPDGTTLEMAGIPSGSCVVGDVVPVEGPVDVKSRVNVNVAYKITLSDPYWIGRYEITQKQYESVLGKRDFSFPGHNLPACGVSWYEAKEFVSKLNEYAIEGVPDGYRFDLPTEAQWEFACRALTTTEYNNGRDGALTNGLVKTFRYELVDKENPSSGMARVPCEIMLVRHVPVSDVVDDIAWYAGNSTCIVHQVGELAPNNWGVYDMHGNVAEWCIDCMNFHDGTKNYIDPVFTDYIVGDEIWLSGERKLKSHVVKGGSVNSFAGAFLTSSGRESFPAASTNSFIGIRVVLVPKQRREMKVDVYDKNVYGISPLDIHVNMQKQRMALQTRARLSSAVEMIQKCQERENSIWKWVDYAIVGLQFADVALSTAITIDDAIHRRNSMHYGVVDSGGSGFGTIQGPASLAEGKSASYKLYVGGKRIDSGVSWSTSTSCLIVSGHGSYANVMAKNPPVKSGSTKAQLRATYNGKTYSKWITVQKTGIFAAGN